MRLAKGQRFNVYATPGSAQVGRQTFHKGSGLLVEAAIPFLTPAQDAGRGLFFGGLFRLAGLFAPVCF
jgi:hypothetical protein